MSWPALALAATVSGASMTLDYTVVDGVVHGTLTGPRAGWVAVGFNDRPELAGSVLLMAASTDQGTHVEEHVARPPRHPPRAEDGGVPGLIRAKLSVEGDRTLFRFQWSTATGDGWLSGLKAGAPLYITLAWSREADFQHHSAERTLVVGEG